MQLTRSNALRNVLALILACSALLNVSGTATAHVRGDWYAIDYPFKGIYVLATVDSYSVGTASEGTASGRIAIWNGTGSDCAFVQFKPTVGRWWHHSTRKVCSLSRQWSVFYWKDDFFFATGGQFSFRTCIEDWFNNTCSKGNWIQVS